MTATERLRLAKGVSQDALSEFAGIADRAYAKLLNPDAPGGRQSGWPVIQAVLDVLAPDGIDVRITARPGPKFDAIRQRFELRYDRAFSNAKTRRELLADRRRRGGLRKRELPKSEREKIGRRLARARKRKIPAAKRKKLASYASRARWLRHRERQKNSGAKSS